MNADTMKKVRVLARDARRWIERISLISDGQINKKSMDSGCAIASAHIFLLLKKNGIKSKIVHNDSHCFVKCEDYIIDVTATQFRSYIPKVFIFKRVELKKVLAKFSVKMTTRDKEDIDYNSPHPFCNFYWWKEQSYISDLRKFNEYQRKSNWPKEQRASKYKKYLGKLVGEIPLKAD